MAASQGFAYLLALVVKWKLLEAFVVPTGAMAPTIYGAHADVVCRNCGMKYAVSMSSWAHRRQDREPVRTVCPNCGQPDIDVRSFPANDGDQLLVHKLARIYVRWPALMASARCVCCGRAPPSSACSPAE